MKAIACVGALLVCSGMAFAQHEGAPTGPATPPLDWKTLEAPLLRHQLQLTSRDQFVKAGESYFSPDGNWIIFQAVAVPKEGVEDPFYAMYIAKLKRDRFTGLVTGLSDITKVSPENSANTCGWFMPSAKPAETINLMFGSTIVRPADEQKAGYQRKTGDYRWKFPAEMEIVSLAVTPKASTVTDKDGKSSEVMAWAPAEAAVMFKRPNYDAECSCSKDGRFILYAHVEDAKVNGRADANIYIYDTKTQQQHTIVASPGYDGGPFFSPDEKSICYRSDRKGNDLLQLFVADLKFEGGVPVGIEHEYQLTDNEAVNWAPFWHPSGKYLVYGSSEVAHSNYELFAIESDMAALRTGKKPADLKHVRVTQADGADILPTFSADGKTVMWTAQRGPKAAGEEKPSTQLWIAEWIADPFASTASAAAGAKADHLP